MKLLEIQSSPRGESSDSISLTKSFIEACKSDKDGHLLLLAADPNHDSS
jgi:FMN-dependent NADH-azoreductase